jgi:cytochrome c-type biogenesis protein CcmE
MEAGVHAHPGFFVPILRGGGVYLGTRMLRERNMKAGRKFLLGAALIVASVGFLIAEGVKETGMYFLTPTELAARTTADSTFYDVGLKMGAKVVPGSIRRNSAAQQVDFQVSDGVKVYPVTYRGVVPDTFTDANDIEVIVEGRLGRDGVFRATEVLAKCGSRYEAEYEKSAKA